MLVLKKKLFFRNLMYSSETILFVVSVGRYFVFKIFKYHNNLDLK